MVLVTNHQLHVTTENTSVWEIVEHCTLLLFSCALKYSY